MTSSPEEALREVSDDLLTDLELLSNLEERKRLMPPEDARAHELASEVAAIASRVLSRSIAEERITRDAHEAASRGDEGAPSRSIAETPRSAHAILEDWRAAERRLATANAGTPDHATAALDAERYRQEYQRLFDERKGDK